jgi:hypothetical protein
VRYELNFYISFGRNPFLYVLIYELQSSKSLIKVYGQLVYGTCQIINNFDILTLCLIWCNRQIL